MNEITIQRGMCTWPKCQKQATVTVEHGRRLCADCAELDRVLEAVPLPPPPKRKT